MRERRGIVYLCVVLSVGFLCGCASTQVKRVDTDKIVDLSGRWNDTDSRLVSEEMIRDCFEGRWFQDFAVKNNREPVVIVDMVINNTHEHINSELFIKDLERSFVKSEKVKLVAAPDERLAVREERQDQQDGNTSRETIKPLGRETGADFLLQGSINAVKDELKGKSVVFYQVNLELTDLTNNQKVWIGQKEIKKVINQRLLSI